MKIQTKEPAPQARNKPACANSGGAKPSKTRIPTTKSHYETADNYVGVIAYLDERHRVIICKDALQWIIQGKRGQRRGQRRWTEKSYLTSPEGVIKASHALCGPLAPNVLATLRALPSKPEVEQ